MGVDIPLINDYKLKFFKTRFLQTITGGLKLKIGYKAPFYVYLNQLLLFIIPVLFIVIGTVFIEVQLVKWHVGIIVTGSMIFAFTLTTNIISFVARKKKSHIKTLTNRTSLFDEDDQVDFESCCGIETIEFIIPGRKHIINVILHSMFAGVVCALGLWYLLPTETLEHLYGKGMPGKILVYVFGLLSLAIAQYSLTAAPPVEWAIYKNSDPMELLPLSRPFHCFLFFVFNLVEWYDHDFILSNQVLHVFFVLCPIWWSLGILPPIHALVVWFAEQVHVHLLGGSPMATDIRTLVYATISFAFFLVVIAVPNGVVGLIIAAGSGFFLSTNLPALARHITLHCRRYTKWIEPTEQEDQFAKSELGFMYIFGLLEFVLVYGVGIVSAGTVGLLNFLLAGTDRAFVYEYIGYGIITLFIVQLVLAEMQKVYVFWGLVRSCIFPNSAQRISKFRERKSKLNGLGYARRVLVNFIAPYTMIAYLAIMLNWEGKNWPWKYGHSSVNVWEMLGATRAFRWAFQSTQNCLLEISILHILDVSSSQSAWRSYGVGLQLLIIGFVRDRISQLLNRIYFYCATVVSHWTDKKQRRSSSLCLVVLNIVLSPIVLIMILVSTAFATPLVPLFTLPIFVVGFPRPIRSWPGKVGAAANICADTMVYKTLAPEMASALRTAFANGSTGDPTPGKHFLIRFQDRLAWVQILERGYLYTTISLKGMELQETSCHTVEALRIDDILEETFEREDRKQCCSFNRHPLNTLHPYDAAIIDAYSDAKNQLTGVIDNPEVIKKIEQNFPKTLVWVLIGHVYWNHCEAEEGKAHFARERTGSGTARSRTTSAASTHPRTNHKESAKLNKDPAVSMAPSGAKVPIKNSSLPPLDMHVAGKTPARSPSPVLSVKSAWSDDLDSLLQDLDDKPTNKSNIAKFGLSSNRISDSATMSQNYGAKVSGLPLSPAYSKQGEVDDLLDELNTYGAPANDIGTPKKSANYKKRQMHSSKTTGGLLGFGQPCQSVFSTKLIPPSSWREMPIEQNKLMNVLSDFPDEWYQHVISFLRFKKSHGKNSQAIATEIAQDEVLKKMYTQLVMACFAVVYKLDATRGSASHIFKTYTGELPTSNVCDWLESNDELHTLVIQAFRLSVKLSIDQILLGETEGNEDLHDTLEEYEDEWYIGLEDDSAWEKSILEAKPQLFALDYNKEQNAYTSRVLTLQDTPVFISSVNGESVRGQWANLNAELLYMTNDDDERYSIQAHPVLLRNLTVQAADPPLGYPVYSSDPILVPTL